MAGGGRKPVAPEIREAAFQWFIDVRRIEGPSTTKYVPHEMRRVIPEMGRDPGTTMPNPGVLRSMD